MGLFILMKQDVGMANKIMRELPVFAKKERFT